MFVRRLSACLSELSFFLLDSLFSAFVIYDIIVQLVKYVRIVEVHCSAYCFIRLQCLAWDFLRADWLSLLSKSQVDIRDSA